MACWVIFAALAAPVADKVEGTLTNSAFNDDLSSGTIFTLHKDGNLRQVGAVSFLEHTMNGKARMYIWDGHIVEHKLSDANAKNFFAANMQQQ